MKLRHSTDGSWRNERKNTLGTNQFESEQRLAQEECNHTEQQARTICVRLKFSASVSFNCRSHVIEINWTKVQKESNKARQLVQTHWNIEKRKKGGRLASIRISKLSSVTNEIPSNGFSSQHPCSALRRRFRWLALIADSLTRANHHILRLNLGFGIKNQIDALVDWVTSWTNRIRFAGSFVVMSTVDKVQNGFCAIFAFQRVWERKNPHQAFCFSLDNMAHIKKRDQPRFVSIWTRQLSFSPLATRNVRVNIGEAGCKSNYKHYVSFLSHANNLLYISWNEFNQGETVSSYSVGAGSIRYAMKKPNQPTKHNCFRAKPIYLINDKKNWLKRLNKQTYSLRSDVYANGNIYWVDFKLKHHYDDLIIFHLN